MQKIKWCLLFVLGVITSHNVMAAVTQSVDASVCFTNEAGANCVFHSPAELEAATNIDSITLTFDNVDILVSNDSPNVADNWGVSFSSPGRDAGSADKFFCNQNDCNDGAIEVDANNENIRTVVTNEENKQQNRLVGTIVITLSRFKDGKLPDRLQSLISSAANGALYVFATYNDDADPTTQPPRTSNAYFWQPDIGMLRDAPLLSPFARVNGLVINITPPADLTLIQEDDPNNPTTLIVGDLGHVTGYLLAFWLARNADGTSNTACSVSDWAFDVNPLTYDATSDDAPAPVLTCGYPLYDEATDGIGGLNPDLSPVLQPCTSEPILPTPTVPSDPYYTPAPDPRIPTLTANLVAVPKTAGTIASKMTLLKSLRARPAQEQKIDGACYTLVYVPSSQKSYAKMGIETGQVYGVTAWALNAAYSDADPTPNLSLSHSNLTYMTSMPPNLASLEKDPSLKLTTADCFVATAASGNINSDSVFYWRILRDEYLTRWGFTHFYYNHAQKWAHWLEEHPKLKPPVNFILEKTGAFFYFSALYTRQTVAWTKEHGKSAFNWVGLQSKQIVEWISEHAKSALSLMSDLWAQEASANEALYYVGTLSSKPGYYGNPGEPSTYVNDYDESVSLEIADSSIPTHSINLADAQENSSSANHSAHPTNSKNANLSSKEHEDDTIDIGWRTNWDLALTGGVLFPSTDRSLYKKYYPKSTLDFELSSSAIFWTSHFGWSVGLKGSYGYNSQESTDPTLGDATQVNERFLYLGTLEPFVGVRYRNVNFLYLQPGIFVGAGFLRLREEGRPKGDSGQNGSGDKNETLGVTHYTPVFDFGTNLDVSLSTLFNYSDRELALSRDILLRLTAIYRLNPSPSALSSSGLVLNAGFAFLF